LQNEQQWSGQRAGGERWLWGVDTSIARQLGEGLIQLVTDVLVPLLLCQELIWSGS